MKICKQILVFFHFQKCKISIKIRKSIFFFGIPAYIIIKYRTRFVFQIKTTLLEKLNMNLFIVTKCANKIKRKSYFKFAKAKERL